MIISLNAYLLASVSSSKFHCKFGLAKTRASLIFFFKSSNSLHYVLPQCNLFILEVKVCNGTVTMEKFTMNFLKYWAAPMKLLASFTLVGIDHRVMAAIFYGSTLNSPPPTMCPRYIKEVFPNSHFCKLAINWFFLKVSSTYITCEKFSFQVLLNISMSSRYTITKESMKGCSTSFISLINISSGLHNPKCITNHSHKPYLILNVVFHMSSYFIFTLWFLIKIC